MKVTRLSGCAKCATISPRPSREVESADTLLLEPMPGQGSDILSNRWTALTFWRYLERRGLENESVSATTANPSRSAQPERWVALLGRRDMPTDGVEDYCIFLGQALAARGIELQRARVSWIENGWVSSLRQLSRECAAWRGRWVLLQYTALCWSRRGFPFGSLFVLAILRRSGTRVAVVFHEPHRQGGSHWMDRIRGACQDWVIEKLYRLSTKNIFTVPIETVAWLESETDKAAFIPIGANIPECVDHRFTPPLPNKEKTVIVFGVTGAPHIAREVADIAGVMREVSKAVAKLRLVVVGRGSIEAREYLVKSLETCNVELDVRGVLPAEEISREFERADVQLFVRGPITLQRGSAIAGIACGLPVVGFRDERISGPLQEVGVEWSPWRDWDGLIRGLIRVLNDPGRWMELHERNIEAQKNYFSWSRIAERYRMVLTA
jgi:glycosyltransferase involved in cell wall biosynthesis